MQFGGFGAKPATSGTGFGTASATGGAFGSAASGGFGSAAPAAASGGGFGAKPTTTTAAGGFGFGGATAPISVSGGFGTAAGGGFGAKPMTATPGFGLGGGFRWPGSAAAPAAAPAAASTAAPTAAQFPYPGIKGPGNAISWAREIDFSQVTEQTVFESLPQPLQQHLMELRSFMHAERDATKKVYDYLNESDKAAAGAGSAASGKGQMEEVSTASYRGLLSKLAALKGGGNRAVDIVAVHCNQHEGQARRQLQRMEKLEASVREYERHVWEPLLEQGLPLTSSGISSGSRGGPYRPAVSNEASSPFVALVEELSRRMDSVNEELSALEATLVPPGRQLRGPGLGDRPGHRGGSAVPGDAIAQINASLLYELNQLRDFSCVAAHLHSRTDTARELFTRQYGQAEADVLFTDTEAQRNGMALFRRSSTSAYFDIPPLPQQQTQPLPAAPAASGLAAPAATATMTGSTLSGLSAKPTMATTATSGGFSFGAASPATAPAATGVAPPGTSTASTATGGGGGGFGAPASTVNAPAAAPATAPAPAMSPAAPVVAPTSLSLGSAATGEVGFGGGRGKSAADGDDRPTSRTR